MLKSSIQHCTSSSFTKGLSFLRYLQKSRRARWFSAGATVNVSSQMSLPRSSGSQIFTSSRSSPSVPQMMLTLSASFWSAVEENSSARSFYICMKGWSAGSMASSSVRGPMKVARIVAAIPRMPKKKTKLRLERLTTRLKGPAKNIVTREELSWGG